MIRLRPDICIAVFIPLLSCCGCTAGTPPLLQPSGATIETRFIVPEGYQRTSADSTSFTHYLRSLPLKPHGTEVKLYDGKTKSSDGVYAAVVDLAIGTRDLHQCADAVMRLRAEYLWKRKLYDQIHFNFTNGFRADYSEWMKGKRIVVKGNDVYWTSSASAGNTYPIFWKYLEMVFSYAGTLSLSKELVPVSTSEMQPGDIFIYGGAPGHAVIVVDMAENSITGKKVFMLAQSYMPAQEIQILINPNDHETSPWYSLDFGQTLVTPEWIFSSSQLKRFSN